MLIKSKRRFIAMIMAILVLVIGGTLSVIYFTVNENIKMENKEMLTIFANSYAENGFPSDDKQARPDEKPDSDSSDNEISSLPDIYDDSNHNYQISTFYAVAFNTDSSVKEYMNEASSGLSDEELQALAYTILNNEKTYGIENGLAFLITTGDDYTLVTLMDTAVVDSTITTLIHYMIIYGALAIVILLLLSALLANWILRPMTEAYEKQKQFISDAGHELKTPISTIAANSELLQRELGAKNIWLDNIIYENSRMSNIVRQLLDLAKLESIRPNIDTIDLSCLVEASVMPFEATAFERNVDFNYSVEENLTCLGDSMSLEKLVSVLTDNAISHCTTGGAVTISLTKENGKSKLTFTNTGDPISDSDKDKLFERFYRADSSRTDDGNNHYGLGLSIAKAIVTAHHGKIWVDCHDGLVIFYVII